MNEDKEPLVRSGTFSNRLPEDVPSLSIEEIDALLRSLWSPHPQNRDKLDLPRAAPPVKA